MTELTPTDIHEQTKGLERLQAFFVNLGSQIQAIKPVDTAPILAHSVTDVASKDKASEYRRLLREHVSRVELLLKEPTDVAFKLHRSFTGLRNILTADDNTALKHLDNQVASFLAEEDRKRRELESLLQAQALAAQQEEARLAAEREKAQKEAVQAEILPWQIDSIEELTTPEVQTEPEPTPIAIVKVTVPDSFAGSKANVPWRANVTDLKALCKAVAEGKVDVDVVQPNMPFLNTAAKLYKEKLSEKFPGVEGVRNTRVKY